MSQAVVAVGWVGVLFVDTRSADTWQGATIPGAVHVPVYDYFISASTETGIHAMIAGLSHTFSAGVLCSLHQVQFALTHADRIIGLKAGRIMFDEPAAQVGAAMIERLYERPGVTDRLPLSG